MVALAEAESSGVAGTRRFSSDPRRAAVMVGWLALLGTGLALVQFLGGPATHAEWPPSSGVAVSSEAQTAARPGRASAEADPIETIAAAIPDDAVYPPGAAFPISTVYPISTIDPVSRFDPIAAVDPLDIADPFSIPDPLVTIDPLITADPGGRIDSADRVDPAGQPGPEALAAVSKSLSAQDMKAGPIDARQEIECLALNIYFEARSESDSGKRAVGHVVMNRVSDRRFPGSVCEVVRQGGEEPLYRCQFSWWCDGKSDQPTDWAAWARSKAIARVVYWGYSKDPTSGALWYHADYVAPYWGAILQPVAKIGRHIFYQDPGSRKVQVATAYETTGGR